MKPRVGPLEPGGVRRLSVSSVCGHLIYLFLVTLRILLLEPLLRMLVFLANEFGQKLLSHDKGRVEAKDLVTGRFLGQGCSGIFYETEWTRWLQGSTARLARKDCPGVKGDIFESEVVRLFELREHPNVMKTLCWTVDDRSCSLVMEYMKDNLSSFVRRKKEALINELELDDPPVAGTSSPPFGLLEAVDIVLQIATGVKYLHEEGIPHGDLKPNNVLIDWKEGRMVVKVADFGLIETKRRTTLISQRALFFRMVEWSAPEVLKVYFASIGEDLDYIRTPSSTKDMTGISSASDCDEKIMMELADSYSFALTCTYILGGKLWNNDQLRKRIPCPGCRPELPSECPEKLGSLISKCWDAEPERRPTFTDICHELQEIVKEQREQEEHLKIRNMMQPIIKEEVQRQQGTLNNTLQRFVKEKEKLQEGMLDIRNAMQDFRKDIMEQLQNFCVQLQDIVKVVQDFTTDSSSLKPMEMVGPNSPVAKPFDADSSKMPKSEPDADRLLRKGKSVVWDQTGEPEENMSSELPSLALGREVMRKFNDPIQTDSRSDDLRSSDEFREPRLEPKHRIFLSNNWAEKDFIWQLCKDLEGLCRFAFVDRYNDNFPEDNYFLPLILEATKQCHVVVLVLSDEFFICSKWPMIALMEFVRAQQSNNQAPRIIPLFLGITESQYREKERQARWIEKWKEFAREDIRIDVREWKDALSTILSIKGLHYNEELGEVAFRELVVEYICEIVPPILQYDVSHVQSLEPLCQPIEEKLEEVSSKYNVQVVGLYGMGGVGKSTISKAICNSMFEKVNGNICHIEFGCCSYKELRRKVLQNLTKVDSRILNMIGLEVLGDLLKRRMHEQKVLLVLDNVWDNDIEEAHMYLRLGFHSGSMVLVTSRSRKVLEQLYIERCNCMEMPNLEEEGAFNMLLHYSGISKESIMERNEWQILQRCAMRCYFPNQNTANFSYHPLSLKVLGSQLRGIELENWDEILKLEKKFNMFLEKTHPVASILLQGYDVLHIKIERIFLDLALIWAPKWNRSIYGQLPLDWEYLCLAHSMTQDEMIRSVKTLQRMGLINEVNDITKLEYNIHDLYVMFAEAKARAGPFYKRWILLDKDGTDVPRELQMYPPNGVCWPVLSRLVIRGSKVKSMKRANLHHCKYVEVMVLHYCKELEEVDVTGMDNLRFMVVISCYKIRRWIGLQTLSNLVVFSHDGIKIPSVPMLESKMIDRSNLVVSSRGNKIPSVSMLESKMIDRSNLVVSSRGIKIPSVSMLEGKMIDHGERDDEVQGDESSG